MGCRLVATVARHWLLVGWLCLSLGFVVHLNLNDSLLLLVLTRLGHHDLGVSILLLDLAILNLKLRDWETHLLVWLVLRLLGRGDLLS